MQRSTVPAKLINGGEPQTAVAAPDGPVNEFGSWVVKVRSYSGPPEEPIGPEAAVVMVPAPAFRQTPALDSPAVAPAQADDPGPAPARQQASTSRSAQSAELVSVVKSRIWLNWTMVVSPPPSGMPSGSGHGEVGMCNQVNV